MRVQYHIKMSRRLLQLPPRGLAALALSLGVLGCGAGDAAGPPAVAVSLAPQAWLVEQIAGSRVRVVQLVAAGESPATYQPSDAQVSRLLGAAVYFRAGVPFENAPWLAAIEASGRVKIIDLRQGIALRSMEEGDGHGRGDDHGHGAGDPHVWLSPRLLAVQARTVAAVLAELDPTHREAYEANLARLERTLGELDRRLRQRLAPLAGREMFVFHPSWGYFADEYGLRQVAIELAGKQPSDRELTRLQQRARAAAVPVVFVQPQITGRAAAAVAAAVGARLEVLDPLAPDVAANLERAAELLLAAGVET